MSLGGSLVSPGQFLEDKEVCQLGSLCAAAGDSCEAGLWFVCCQSHFSISSNTEKLDTVLVKIRVFYFNHDNHNIVHFLAISQLSLMLVFCFFFPQWSIFLSCLPLDHVSVPGMLIHLLALSIID